MFFGSECFGSDKSQSSIVARVCTLSSSRIPKSFVSFNTRHSDEGESILEAFRTDLLGTSHNPKKNHMAVTVVRSLSIRTTPAVLISSSSRLDEMQCRSWSTQLEKKKQFLKRMNTTVSWRSRETIPAFLMCSFSVVENTTNLSKFGKPYFRLTMKSPSPVGT